MANKNKFSNSNSQESSQITVAGEKAMTEQPQHVDEQINMEQQAEVQGNDQPEQELEQECQEATPEQDGNHQHESELAGDNETRILTIDDIVKPGKFGVTNSQMIPAIKQAILEGSIEKLELLRAKYFYSFENSLRYLNKKEREFIQSNLK